MSRHLKLSLAAALAIGTALPCAAGVRADVIERVVAVINDEAIFYSDLRERALPFLPQVMEMPSEAERLRRLRELYAQPLEHLIDEQLIVVAAEELSIRVTSQDVESAIRNVQAQTGLTADEFWAAVREQGYTEARYRGDLRRQVLRLKVMNTHVRGRVNITEDDVHRRYDDMVRQANRHLRFRAAHVLVPLSSGASATVTSETQGRVNAIHQGLTPDNFDAAIEANGGGDLGWLSQGDLPEELEEALMSMEQGDISAPVRGSSGYHIFLLYERERGAVITRRLAL